MGVARCCEAVVSSGGDVAILAEIARILAACNKACPGGSDGASLSRPRPLASVL